MCQCRGRIKEKVSKRSPNTKKWIKIWRFFFFYIYSKKINFFLLRISKGRFKFFKLNDFANAFRKIQKKQFISQTHFVDRGTYSKLNRYCHLIISVFVISCNCPKIQMNFVDILVKLYSNNFTRVRRSQWLSQTIIL